MTTPLMIGPDDPVPEGYEVVAEDEEGKSILPKGLLEEQEKRFREEEM